MTRVRATASLPDLDTGQEADVDPTEPLWGNRIRSGLVIVVDEDQDETPAPEGDLVARVRGMTVEQVLAEVDAGRMDPAEAAEADQAGKRRTSLGDALVDREIDAG